MTDHGLNADLDQARLSVVVVLPSGPSPDAPSVITFASSTCSNGAYSEFGSTLRPSFWQGDRQPWLHTPSPYRTTPIKNARP